MRTRWLNAPEIAECIDASADTAAARSAVERLADAAPRPPSARSTNRLGASLW
jgi:hypothetical protein